MGIKNIEDFYPLSPMQQGMLFHTLAAPNSGVYFEQFSCTVKGDLNLKAFDWAWQQVINRHPILRTSFAWDGLKEPVQIVHSQVKLPCLQKDWRDLSPTQQQVQIETFLQQDRTRDFELTCSPLMRLVLIQLADDHYYFTWSQHHLLLDGWSVPLVFQEVLAFYQAGIQGQNFNLPRSRPYRDYIVWLQQQNIEQAETYWRQTLQGFTAPTNLGIKQTLDDDYDRQKTVLDVTTTTTLKSLAQKHQLTFNTLIQGAWALLLSRYSHEQDLVFGATISGRPATLAKAESMIGLFINTLPVRIQIDSATCLISWLKEIQAQQVEARQYEYTPLWKIQGWSEVAQGQPLFESIVVFENYPWQEIPLAQPDLNLEIKVDRSFDRTNYPLTLGVSLEQQLSLEIAYQKSDRFDSNSINRMLGHLKTLLESMAVNPQQRLAEFSLLTAAERRQLLIEWNDTQVNYPQDQCIHHLFEAQVELTPDAIAVESATQQLTYRELNTQANQLAHYLQKLGVKPETLIGICVARSPMMLIAILAILKAGGAYIPIDPDYPTERINYIIVDAEITLIITQSCLTDQLPKIDLVCLDTDWQIITQESIDNPDSNVQPNNLAYCIYTSGSTGKPKGVMIQHDSVVNFVCAAVDEYQITESDRLLQFASISFDVAVEEIYPGLVTGGTVVLASQKLASAEVFLAQCQQLQITVLDLPTAYWQQLVAEIVADNLTLPKCIRLVIIGGEQANPQYVQQWQDYVGKRPQLINAYGPTEGTVETTVYPLSCQFTSKLPIGKPLPNVQVYVLDSNLQPVPVGVTGELYIGGAGVARGYLNRPELTKERFIPYPLNNSKIYKTGDLVKYLADGNLEYLGRVDHQVKIRGFRVELGEIEAVIATNLAIQDCVVLADEDYLGNKTLTAYYLSAQQLNSKKVREFLKPKLPEYMIPAVWVELETFPLTPNGKVDRQALSQLERSPLAFESELPSVVTPVTEILAGIWSEVLDVQSVGVNDNFFELGGHSLLATRLISRVKQVFAIALPLRSLFENPTVSSLAECLQTSLNPTRQLPIERVPHQEKLPLSFAQHRLWFIAQLEPDSPDYNLPAILRFQGNLNIMALEASFNEIVRRHEVLCTSFVEIDGEPFQKIAPSFELNLAVVELPKLAENQQIQDLIQEEVVKPFDLSQLPLFRAKVLRLNSEEHILIFVIHHIIADFWSEELLLQELTVLYENAIADEPFSLPELTIQYADFAVWQRQHLQGDLLASHLSYWQQQLEGDLPVLHFPADRPRPTTVSDRGAIHNFALTKDLSDAVGTLSQKEGVTLFITLLTAFKVLLSIYTKQPDFIVGSPVANRNHLDLEPLIGFFVNTLLLRTNLSGNPSFRELLTRVREVVLNGYAHQELPFEKLVEVLQPHRNTQELPLLQVWFTFANNHTANLQLSDLTISELEFDHGIERYELRLDLSKTNEGIKGSFGYKTDLFDSATINNLAKYLAIILEKIVAQPDIKLSDLVSIITQTVEQEKNVREKVLATTSFQKFKQAKRKIIDINNN